MKCCLCICVCACVLPELSSSLFLICQLEKCFCSCAKSILFTRVLSHEMLAYTKSRIRCQYRKVLNRDDVYVGGRMVVYLKVNLIEIFVLLNSVKHLLQRNMYLKLKHLFNSTLPTFSLRLYCGGNISFHVDNFLCVYNQNISSKNNK